MNTNIPQGEIEMIFIRPLACFMFHYLLQLYLYCVFNVILQHQPIGGVLN